MPIGLLDTLRGEKWRVRGLQHYRQVDRTQHQRGHERELPTATEDLELDVEESHQLLRNRRRSQDSDGEEADAGGEVEVDHELGLERGKDQLFWSAIRPSSTNPGGFRGRTASYVLAGVLIGVVALISILVAVQDRRGGFSSNDGNQRPNPAAITDVPNVPDAPDRVGDAGLSAPDYRQRYAWHSLAVPEKQAYITSLQCLRSLPPVVPYMPQNASLYSDFPYIHAHVGYRTHSSASFLPWHRYFLHIYEQTLRRRCGYEGRIPYWDWTRDADANAEADLGSSMVFDAHTGFGSDGARNGTITAGQHGRCVTDGPFAGLEVLWYDVKYQPHCLSRGFRTDAYGTTGPVKIDGTALRTSEIDKILNLDDYESFVSTLERQVHDVIPFGVGGDFETFSAPFEPLFWLHHAQLDRLWSIWQDRAAERRKKEYSGLRFRNSFVTASLDDELEYGLLLKGLELDEGTVTVEQVMDIEGGCSLGGMHAARKGGALCYSYG